MTKMTYGEQLKHPNWQRKRLERLEAAGWACEECGTKDVTLHVHHRRYVKGRMAWDYEADELKVLCETCHEEEHAIGDDLSALLSHVDSTQALALLKGFWDWADWFDGLEIGSLGPDRDPRTWLLGIVARLCVCLEGSDLKQVAEFAVSLTAEHSEERNRWPSYECEFDSLGFNEAARGSDI